MSRYTSDEQKQIAGEILRQLGGNRFIAMTGAKQFMCSENSKECPYIVFKVGRNSGSINYVKITLNSMDLYDIEYSRIHGMNHTIKAESEGLYDNMLAGDFQQKTGMALTL